MPTNFNAAPETTAAPNFVMEKPVQDVSENIRTAGQAVSSLAGMFKQQDDKQQLGAFSAGLADIETASINYQTEKANIYQQMKSADERVYGELQARLTTIEAGRVSGILPPQYARVQTLKLIKDYSTNYPSLAKDVRSMANESMDNLREVANEVFGDNPQNKAAQALQQESAQSGTPVPELIHRYQVKGVHEATMQELQTLNATNSLENGKTAQTISRLAFQEASAGVGELAQSWTQRLANGEMPSEAQLQVEIGSMKDQYMRKYMGEIVNRSLPGMSYQEMKDSLAPAFDVIDNMQRTLSGTGTLEERLKLLKQQSELQAAQKELDVFGSLSVLGGAFRYLTGPQATASIAAAVTVQQTRGLKLNAPEWDMAARSAAANGDITFQVGLNFVRTPQGQRWLAENLSSYMAGTVPDQAEDGASHAITVRDFDSMLAKLTDPTERSKFTQNALPRFTWKDVTHNKNLSRELAANPQFTTEAMKKAADYSAKRLVDGGIDPSELVIDHSQLGNVFSIKGQKPMKDRNHLEQEGYLDRAGTVKDLNKTYMEIINTFGASGVDVWLEQLGLTNISKKSLDPAPAKKKVSSGASQYTKPTGYDDLISQSATDAGVDPTILKVLLGTESSFKADAVSPRGKDFGLGIGQISVDHGMSDEDRLNPEKAIPAAARILAGYVKDSGGDYREAMMKYKGAVSKEGRASMAPVIDSILAVSGG
jgi:hypothetical protein